MNGRPFLQNHPGFRDFPVKNYTVMKQVVFTQGKGLFPHFAVKYQWLIILLLPLTMLAVFVSGVSIVLMFSKSAKVTVDVLIAFTPLWIGSALAVGLLGYLYHGALKRPQTEQKHFYQQTGQGWLPEEKRQALRLTIVSDYNNGSWSETLSYYPLQSQTEHDTFKYVTLSPVEAEVYRSSLHRDWDIVNRAGYYDGLRQLNEGMHSQILVSTRHHQTEDGWKEFQAYFSSLIEEPFEYAESCFQVLNNRPPQLLWGFDLHRALVLSRHAFMAGYISEEEAWTELLKITQIVHEIFPDFDAFYTNYRFGHAYWSRDYEQIKERLKNFRHYQQDCQWPIRQLAWPAPGKIVLPEEIRTGLGWLLSSNVDEIKQKWVL